MSHLKCNTNSKYFNSHAWKNSQFDFLTVREYLARRSYTYNFENFCCWGSYDFSQGDVKCHGLKMSQKVTKVSTQILKILKKSQNVYNLTVMHWKPFQSRLLFEWDFVSDFETLYNLDIYKLFNPERFRGVEAAFCNMVKLHFLAARQMTSNPIPSRLVPHVSPSSPAFSRE